MYGINYNEIAEETDDDQLNEYRLSLVTYNRILDLLSQIAHSETTETPFDDLIDNSLKQTVAFVFAGMKHVQTQYEAYKDTNVES